MDSCLSEDRPVPLSFETASFRSYLKQFSWSSHAHHGIQKCSRSMKPSFCAYSESQERTPLLRAQSGLDGILLSSCFLDDIMEEHISSAGSVSKSNGLVRSQSYPLEGFYDASENRIIDITKTSDLFQRSICKKNDKDVCLSNNPYDKPRPCNQDLNPLPPAIDESLQDKRDKDSETGRMKGNLIECSTDVDVAMETGSKHQSIASKGQIDSSLGTSVSIEILMPEDVHQVQGDPPQVDAMSSQLSHCLAARHCPPGSKMLACGRRREMEDRASVVPSFTALPCGIMGMCCCDTSSSKQTLSDLHFFGVYDGHGGSQASTYCKERFHILLAEELQMLNREGSSYPHQRDGWDETWNKTLTDCFLKIDKEVGGVCPKGICDNESVDHGCTCCEDAIAPENVGTTAVVAVVGSRQIVVANCGDSRAVLSRGGQAVALSTDHKPEREDETHRIEAAGGRVICWDGYRVGGFLALSRAIGDRYLKRYVISEPEVTCVQRNEEDEVLILASDGIWDVLSNEYACEIARKALAAAKKKRENRTFSPGEDPAAATAAAMLAKLAYNKGSKDNISVVVVDLKS
ncbi:hypothetical protein KP509_06G067500 [Ceratopteris richardii]|uniref:protein-serine/threonine phosphatase n=1 Tax=Ceratopteris richardii TaxID=49495 RepID=A0A8T2ULT2_CERRI|nr:hypothetical protein KP509_06G067500 [Ceratopteris richardii]KAH7435508.1 hypothetical protein KP509_06G067500 [Ceratopteris richardii]KAH7435509.1 hypothetical protein KP509_06G067500 [Ceratopteris richardii]KAH7435510.1 hypothetical protein KP509_06G067500 [Ceratopteris richardii]